MIGKKLYYIVISAETEAYTEKYLTESEVEVIKEIFEDTSSAFLECWLEEIPSKEKFEDDFLSIIESGALSLHYMIDKIKDHYNITYDTALYLYNRYKNIV